MAGPWLVRVAGAVADGTDGTDGTHVQSRDGCAKPTSGTLQLHTEHRTLKTLPAIRIADYVACCSFSTALERRLRWRRHAMMVGVGSDSRGHAVPVLFRDIAAMKAC